MASVYPVLDPIIITAIKEGDCRHFLRWRSDEFTTVKDCVCFYVRFISADEDNKPVENFTCICLVSLLEGKAKPGWMWVQSKYILFTRQAVLENNEKSLF